MVSTKPVVSGWKMKPCATPAGTNSRLGAVKAMARASASISPPPAAIRKTWFSSAWAWARMFQWLGRLRSSKDSRWMKRSDTSRGASPNRKKLGTTEG